jgi:hypothetical protein
MKLKGSLRFGRSRVGPHARESPAAIETNVGRRDLNTVRVWALSDRPVECAGAAHRLICSTCVFIRVEGSGMWRYQDLALLVGHG